jgi:hypothetical protein
VHDALEDPLDVDDALDVDDPLLVEDVLDVEDPLLVDELFPVEDVLLDEERLLLPSPALQPATRTKDAREKQTRIGFST